MLFLNFRMHIYMLPVQLLWSFTKIKTMNGTNDPEVLKLCRNTPLNSMCNNPTDVIALTSNWHLEKRSRT